MRTDEQEYLIQSIRAGAVRYQDIRIVPATIDQYAQASKIYVDAFQDSLDQGLMTELSLEKWMLDSALLPDNFLVRRDQLNNAIDNAKLELYTNRTSKTLIKQSKQNLVNLRASLRSLLEPKSAFLTNTCEFIAQTAKLVYILKRTTYKKNKLYKEANFSYILNLWQSSILSETHIRELARSHVWKSIWTTKGYGFTLFKKRPNTEMTINQRNLITWSKMYDNIQESLDCPSDDVIEDDDMLDGWFIEQKNKREKEKIEAQKEVLVGKSNKMQNASHVFIPQHKDAVSIDSLNAHSDMSKELHHLIKKSE